VIAGLPVGWTVDVIKRRGIVIKCHVDGVLRGTAVLNYQQRSWTLGMVRLKQGASGYEGKEWKDEMHRDAIEALKDAVKRDTRLFC